MLRIVLTTLCLAMLGLPAYAASDRADIEGLVSAAPVPEGYTVRRQDAKDGNKVIGHYLLLTKEGSPTKAVIQIERREITARPARVATVKAYVNGAASTWKAQGWTAKLRSLPKFETIDFNKPVAIDLDLTKADESPMAAHMEIFFDHFTYQVLSVSSEDASLKEMIRWSQTVRPVHQDMAKK
jgi:hypothetical protein